MLSADELHVHVQLQQNVQTRLLPLGKLSTCTHALSSWEMICRWVRVKPQLERQQEPERVHHLVVSRDVSAVGGTA